MALTPSVCASLAAPVPMPARLTTTLPASSLVVTSLMASRVGRSFTGFTVSMNASVAVPPSASVTVTVRVTLPDWLVAGSTLSVRLAPLPPNVTLFVGTNEESDELTLRVRLPEAVSTSPTVKGIAPVAVSSLTDRSAMSLMVGRSFSELTVRVNMSLTAFVPSLTVIVMVVVPNWFVAGVMVTVRLAPLPPKVMFALGTSAVTDDPPDTLNAADGVSTSPMVNEIAPVPVSSSMARFARSVITGGSFTGVTVSRKVLVAVAPSPSVTIRVIIVVPLALVPGRTVIDRLEPLPPNVMLPLGTSAGLEEKPASPRLPADVSTSATVNATGASTPSSAMVRSEIDPIVGEALARIAACALLSERLPSMAVVVTLARLVCRPETIGTTSTLTVAMLLVASVPSEHVTRLPLRVQLPWLGDELM